MRYYKVSYSFDAVKKVPSENGFGYNLLVTGRDTKYVVMSANNKAEAKKSVENWLWVNKVLYPCVTDVCVVTKGY